MVARTSEETKRIAIFLDEYFGEGYKPSAISTDEQKIIDQVLAYVDQNFGVMKYILGLGIDFTMLAQALSNADTWGNDYKPDLSEEQIFERYEFVAARGAKAANTLSFKYEGVSYGIRKFEEKVVDLFNEMDRTGYPSAYVYNTGQWHKYKPQLLIPCFSLSKSGKFVLCQRLIDIGLQKLSKNRYFGRDVARIRLFEKIIRDYPRTHADETSGAVFQGIAYGYCKADRPHLSLVVDKVRTGSSRQRRFGDIDGYHGIDLELSVEVKDHSVTADNVSKELGEFLTKVSTNRILGITIVRTIDEQATKFICETGACPLPESQMLAEVSRWDWPKQNAAVLGLLHYLSHVEQEPDAVRRLLEFIQKADPSHDSLAYLVSP